MYEQIATEVARFQQGLQGKLDHLTQAFGMMPEAAEGSDPTGSVTVTLGSDGIPTAIRVQPHWSDHLQPGEVGQAVLQASRAAMTRRVAVWEEALDEEGWTERGASGGAASSRSATAPPSSEAAQELHRRAATVKPRPLSELIEGAFGALSDLDTSAASEPEAPAEAVGEAASGKVLIAVGPGGITRCEADPRWVAEQSATRLTNALAAALAAASAQTENTADQPPPTPSAPPLASELLAALSNPELFRRH